ncbi:hypothetical protein [Streptomyces pristinaespiralis]|uniref:hypothetical protein n=1 Tax=Streptomyces pristinaespiralis TaxID=38300 RepID=UPI0033CC31B4
MHSDIHLMLHGQDADELRAAATRQVPRERLRLRLGSALVALGLRLLQQPCPSADRVARLA